MKYQGISIIKHKNCNTWYARYRQNGKQFYVSAKTQLECYNILKQAIKQKVKQELKKLPAKEEPKQTITFIEWFNKWLELYKKDVKEATRRVYKTLLTHTKNINSKDINQVTSIDIMQEINSVKGERTKQKLYEFLNSIFVKAEQNELINKNPLKIIDKPKHKKVNGLAFSNEDELKLIEILNNQHLDMYLLCLYQGLRKGEALALTINDIDFKEKTININKSLNEKNKIDTTKNIYSNRIIPLFDKLIKILEQYKDKKERIFEYTYKQGSHIFENILKENFKGKNYTQHSLRHTFITNCQEKGIPLHIIQKWVGHNIGSQVTSQVYTHTRKLAERENIDKMNNYSL